MKHKIINYKACFSYINNFTLEIKQTQSFRWKCKFIKNYTCVTSFFGEPSIFPFLVSNSDVLNSYGFDWFLVLTMMRVTYNTKMTIPIPRAVLLRVNAILEFLSAKCCCPDMLAFRVCENKRETMSVMPLLFFLASVLCSFYIVVVNLWCDLRPTVFHMILHKSIHVLTDG